MTLTRWLRRDRLRQKSLSKSRTIPLRMRKRSRIAAAYRKLDGQIDLRLKAPSSEILAKKRQGVKRYGDVNCSICKGVNDISQMEKSMTRLSVAYAQHMLPSPPIASKQCVLTIAGSDSSGGSGIQADLKTFAALGLHGLSAITAITAQNSREISTVELVPAALLRDQIETLRREFSISAVKIGMLGNAANIRIVATWLRANPALPVVLDPVLISTSGKRLLPIRALDVLREELTPLCTLLTPNIPEALQLLNMPKSADVDGRNIARALVQLSGRAVLVKGGHLPLKNKRHPSRVRDFFSDGTKQFTFVHTRQANAARGTGCTLAAAIAAGLAQRRSMLTAIRDAERYLQDCLRQVYLPQTHGYDIHAQPMRHYVLEHFPDPP